MTILAKPFGVLLALVCVLGAVILWLEALSAVQREREAKARVRHAEHYARAQDFERQQDFAAAYRYFNWLCDGVMFDPGPAQEHPCKATIRLNERFSASYREVMAALEAHRTRHGAYPDSLAAILGDLSPANRPMAERFSYAHADDKVSVGTNQIVLTFDLKR